MSINTLIVEDESITALELKYRLIEMDFNVIGVADNGEDAAEMIKNKRPHLVLLDVILRGSQSGIDIAEFLNENKIPFIYLSASSDKLTKTRMLQTNPYGFIQKPFDFFLMQDVLNKFASEFKNSSDTGEE